MDSCLKNYKWWSAFDRTGATTICIRDTLALANRCSAAHLNSKGRIACVTLHGINANLLLLGTYWPSGSSEENMAYKLEMQEQIQTIMQQHNNCTPLMI
eukprot:407967-Pelagomonas_calceolata.AAC.1